MKWAPSRAKSQSVETLKKSVSRESKPAIVSLLEIYRVELGTVMLQPSLGRFHLGAELFA